MIIGLQLLPQIRGREDDGAPDPGELDPVKKQGGWIAQQLSTIVASLTASYHKQHNADDTHSTITATGSITERGRALAMGEWRIVGYDATAFTGSGSLTWTVTAAQQLTFQYTLIGKTMLLAFNFSSTTVGGVADLSLRVRLPDQFSSAHNVYNPIVLVDAGTAALGFAVSVVGVANPQLQFNRADGANFSLGTTSVRGMVAFDVV